MYAEKLSISLPHTLASFVDSYQIEHAYKSRSEVIQDALKLLQQKELEQCYREANKEIDPLYENTVGDGLDHEAW